MPRQIAESKASPTTVTMIAVIASMGSNAAAQLAVLALRSMGVSCESAGTHVRIMARPWTDTAWTTIDDRIRGLGIVGLATIGRIPYTTQRAIDYYRVQWRESLIRAYLGMQRPTAVKLFDVKARDNDLGAYLADTIASAGDRIVGDTLTTIQRWTDGQTAAESIRPHSGEVAAYLTDCELQIVPIVVAVASHARDLEYSAIAAPSTRQRRDADFDAPLSERFARLHGTDPSVTGDDGKGRGSIDSEIGGYTPAGNPIAGTYFRRYTGRMIASGGNAGKLTPEIEVFRLNHGGSWKATIGAETVSRYRTIRPDLYERDRERRARKLAS